MRWIFNDNLKGNWSLQQQAGYNYTTHLALCKVRVGHFSLILCSQATTTISTAADSTLETEAADSESVASPSQENKLPRLSCSGICPWPGRRAATLWPRQQKKKWCCCLACWLSDTYLCLDPLSLVREDCVFHRGHCQQRVLRGQMYSKCTK